MSSMFLKATLLLASLASPYLVAATTCDATDFNCGIWHSTGCWADSSPRTLHFEVGSSDNMTIETCLDACTDAGFILAGLEFGAECFCGNARLYSYGSSEACLMPCAGNASQICGGPDAIDIYNNGSLFTVGPTAQLQSHNGYKLTECWNDGLWTFGGPRILPHFPTVPIPAEQMTVEKCIDGCAASGFTSAGIEFGQECWCGNVTFPPGESDPGLECSQPCLANARESCGGSNRILIYTSLDLHF